MKQNGHIQNNTMEHECDLQEVFQLESVSETWFDWQYPGPPSWRGGTMVLKRD